MIGPAGSIPRRSADCVHCHQYIGIKFVRRHPCEQHPGGADYVGPDAYEPSDWVKSVVDKRYRGTDGVFLCTGYDPRCGFWMRHTERADDIRNVSERAIGRTYHRIWESCS